MPELVNCPACARQLSSEAAFCPNCGQPVGQGSTARELPPPLASGARIPTVRRFVPSAIIVALAIGVVIWSPDLSWLTGLLGGREQVAVDEEFTIRAGGWDARKFVLERIVNVTVSVRCSGGGLHVDVIAEADFEAFQRTQKSLYGGEFHNYPDFSMERTSEGTKKGRLTAGTYFVVLRNPRPPTPQTPPSIVHLRVGARR